MKIFLKLLNPYYVISTTNPGKWMGDGLKHEIRIEKISYNRLKCREAYLRNRYTVLARTGRKTYERAKVVTKLRVWYHGNKT